VDPIQVNIIQGTLAGASGYPVKHSTAQDMNELWHLPSTHDKHVHNFSPKPAYWLQWRSSAESHGAEERACWPEKLKTEGEQTVYAGP
jgi:hypothetical protein